MPEIRPFHAMHFSPAVTGPMDALVAPAAEDLPAAAVAPLLAASPYNVVRLDVGEDETGDTRDHNRYTRARRLLLEWQKAGVLRRDADPTFYLYEQEHARGGRHLMRLALVAVLPLPEGPAPAAPPSAGVRVERDRMMQACHLQTGLPLLAMEDRDGAFYDVLDRMQYDADDQRAELRDASGALHRFKAVHGPKYARLVAEAAADRPLSLLAGHAVLAACHRHREWARAEQPDFGPEAPESFFMAAAVSSRDPGLVLLPAPGSASPAIEGLFGAGGGLTVATGLHAPPPLLAGLVMRRIDGL